MFQQQSLQFNLILYNKLHHLRTWYHLYLHLCLTDFRNIFIDWLGRELAAKQQLKTAFINKNVVTLAKLYVAPFFLDMA